MASRAAWCLLALGCLSLSAALGWALFARDGATRQLEAETGSLRADLGQALAGLASLRSDVEACERRLEASRRDANAAELELQSVLVADPRLAAESGPVLEGLDRRIADLEAEIQSAGRDAGAVAAVNPAPAPPVLPDAAAEAPREEARRAEASPQEVERSLARCRASIVLVVSAGGRMATGLVVGTRKEKLYVLTVSAAVRPGADVTCLLQVPVKGGEAFESVDSEVVYRDRRAPLIIIEGEAESTASIAALTEASFEGAAPEKGEAVYAVGAHAVGLSAFTGSVFEGIVSAIDDAPDGGPRFLRTTLPMNDGSPGSVVVTAGGKAVGVLWQGTPGLERASWVLPAASVRPALDRFRRRLLGADLGDAAARERGAGALGVEAFVDLGEPLSAEAEVFAGPDDLVLVWERPMGRLRAFRSGSASPVWETGRGAAWSSLAYRPWQPYGLLSSVSTGVAVAVNLRSGKVGPRLTDAVRAQVERAWAAFPIGKAHVLALPQGLAIADFDSGRAFALRPIKATLMAHVEDLLTLSTDEGDVGWLTRGEFLTIVARIDAIQLEIENLSREKRSSNERFSEISKRSHQVNELSQQLARGIRIFKVPGGIGRDFGRPGTSFHHVPGTYLHLIGRNVWQIGPDRVVRLGRFERLWHGRSGAGQTVPGDGAVFEPPAAPSPDGRYAVTATHVHDVERFEAVAELPFPSRPAGFTSKGGTIYAHDAERQRLVFVSLEALLSGPEASRGPQAGGDPGEGRR